MTLEELGWTERDAAAFAQEHADSGLVPARVVRTSKHVYHVVGAEGRMIARVSGGFRHRNCTQADFPAVGDWVGVKPRPSTDELNIHVLLERRTAISRQAIGGSGRGRRIEEQVLVANVDVAFLVAALDNERGFNVRRLERYLALVHNGGAKPVIVLNKIDLSDAPEEAMQQALAIAGDTPVHAMSAETGAGIEQLQSYIDPTTTLVLLGPSGVGKSSLINRLHGRELLPVGEIRASDARGKHTTTWSEISLLAHGGVLIDTPGMREILLWSDEQAIGETFPEIRELGLGCKFADCTHGAEPGCAVQAALEADALDRERFESYLQLREEVASAKQQRERSGSKRDGTRVIRVRREKRRRFKRK